MGKLGAKKRQRDADEVPETATSSTPQKETAASNPRPKRARTETNKSLFVRSLPATATSESLTEFFSQHYPVKHATVVLDPKTKTSRGYGFVSFADPEDAVEAKEKLNNNVFGGRKLRLDIAQPRLRDGNKGDSAHAQRFAEDKKKRQEELAEAKKAPKLIIRNLPWSIKSSAQLSALFTRFGKVKFADLPNDKGKLSGFGFVTLRGRKNAEKALAEINGTEIDGRVVAVDWAVDKQTWDEKHKDDEKAEAPAKEKKAKAKKEKKPAEDDDDDLDQEGMTQEDKDLANFFKNQGGNLESESEHDSDEEGEEEKDEEEEGPDNVDADEDDDEEDEDDSDDGGADLELSDVSDMEEEEEKPAKRVTTNDTTLFLRNLPYTATDESLKAHFGQFGAVRYARIVKDRATDRPAGTGFVCFFNEEEFLACLKGAPRRDVAANAKGGPKHSVLQNEFDDPTGKYTLDGRILHVSHAVNKDEAERLAAEASSGRRNKDTRKLFLLAEGSIPASSPLFQKLPLIEVRMREASAKQRKKMIETNPSLHMSLTRLALRNIPRNITSKELKALAREAVVGFAKDVKEGRRQPLSKEENTRGGLEDKEAEKNRKQKGKGVVSQAKVVYESNSGTKVTDEKGGKSRGYGFIEYSSHRWALMGLRYLNGHPLKNEEGKTQRLIVEFAIENAGVVMRRKQQLERGPGERTGGPRAFGQTGGVPRSERTKSKWKELKRNREAKLAAENNSGKGAVPPLDKTEAKDANSKLALRTKIIARKRLMRKKKGDSRGGK